MRRLLCAALLGATSVSAQPPGFDAYAANALKVFQTPGMAIAVVLDGRVLFAKGYGVKRIGDPAPVDAHTLFQIASNTKAFTAASLAMLVDSGRMTWDDRVIDHMPDFRLYDAWVTREFRVRDMLSHRSGLGLGAGDLLWFHSNYSRAEVIHRIRAAKPVTSFRSQYAYDNVMYVAAGELIPAITGTPWDEFVRRRIFQPLGMREAVTGLGALPAGADLASCHGVVNGKIEIVPRDTADVTGPAGSILANVSDIAKWMVVQLDSGRLRTGGRLWSAERTAEMWTPEVSLPGDDPVGPPANFAAYGFGWALRDYRGYKIVRHDGGLAGMTSRTMLIPEKKLGIIVLTNGESDLSAAMAFRLADAYLGTPALDWTALFATEAHEADSAATETEKRTHASRAAHSSPSLPLAQYTGAYSDSLYGGATIAMEGDHLVLRFEHSPAFVGDLEHWQYDTFIAHWRTAHIEDAYVTFALTPAGAIKVMTMAPVSPLADFSFDYQDLNFMPVRASGS